MALRVLYANIDFEPITVIDVPAWADQMFMEGCRVRFVPILPVRYVNRDEPPNFDETFRFVEVWAEPLRRGNQRTFMLFTDHDDIALALRSEMLPGQRRQFQESVKDSFFQGFITALEMLR